MFLPTKHSILRRVLNTKIQHGHKKCTPKVLHEDKIYRNKICMTEMNHTPKYDISLLSGILISVEKES